jgi:hypothetical protein
VLDGALQFQEGQADHVLQAGDCLELGDPSPCVYRNHSPAPLPLPGRARPPAGLIRGSGRSGDQGWYEPGVQARVATLIAFQALMVTIRQSNAATSASVKTAATSW